MFKKVLFLVMDILEDQAKKRGTRYMKKKMPLFLWPLLPFEKLFWIIHPRKAFYAFMTEKALKASRYFAGKYLH